MSAFWRYSASQIWSSCSLFKGVLSILHSAVQIWRYCASAHDWRYDLYSAAQLSIPQCMSGAIAPQRMFGASLSLQQRMSGAIALYSGAIAVFGSTYLALLLFICPSQHISVAQEQGVNQGLTFLQGIGSLDWDLQIGQGTRCQWALYSCKLLFLWNCLELVLQIGLASCQFKLELYTQEQGVKWGLIFSQAVGALYSAAVHIGHYLFSFPQRISGVIESY